MELPCFRTTTPSKTGEGHLLLVHSLSWVLMEEHPWYTGCWSTGTWNYGLRLHPYPLWVLLETQYVHLLLSNFPFVSVAVSLLS